MYRMINVLRNSSEFWEDIKNFSMRDVAEKWNFNLQSLFSAMQRGEFIEKYKSVYTYPKLQTQKQIERCISSWGIDVKDSTRKVISPYELDIWLPEYKIGIEYNGNYWHSEAHLDSEVAREIHLAKTLMCRERGIHLIHVFEYDWKWNRSGVLSWICSFLNKKSIDYDIIMVDSINFKSLYNIESDFYFSLRYKGLEVGWFGCQIQDGMLILNSCSFCFKFNLAKFQEWLIFWAKSNRIKDIIAQTDTSFDNGWWCKEMGMKQERTILPQPFLYDRKNLCYYKGISEKDGCFKIWNCGEIIWKM